MSIIIPTYEQEELAFQAAMSALSQDYPHLEVVVVDDASPSARYASIQAIDDLRLRFVRRDSNVGRTENYRRSLRDLAQGDWAMVLDGDDYLTDASFISAAIAAAAADPGVVIVAARTETRTSDRSFVTDHPGDRTVTGLALLSALPDTRYFFQHLAVLYRRPQAVALDFYRSATISSDWESLYRLASHGNVRFLDRVVGVWRIHSGNASGSRERQAMIDNLDIWEPVYTEAVAQGLPATVAQQRCTAMIRYMMRQHIPRVARSWADLRDYLVALRRQHPSALMGMAHCPTLVRLALAMTGYYGKR
ncbi:glycosyltransferase [Novosphingobium sp. HII-3]|uniref:glycosyltransferase family 2 protein n=1 Tax=Novosphingobium sp. HII-3 TaxID=2075565 RepID=UPI001E569DB3|nr:glycosyltransferase [Novosphingobium sp. HII-3]